MCAFNDTIIKRTINLSDNGENYFYTYVKLKKLLESNKNIKNVFLSFTNNQIAKAYDSTTIWNQEYVNFRYPKYAANITSKEFFILLKNNPLGVIKAQQKAFKNNVHLVFDEQRIINRGYWGQFNYLKRDKTDSLVKTMSESTIQLKKMDYALETLNYLDKIISLCNMYKINIFLVRSPLHKKSAKLNNEQLFQKLVNEKYKNIPFLDFKDFPLNNTDFGDLDHLNYKGSTKFSVFFNSLIKERNFYNNWKREFIDLY
jgi:hypothetical protein